MDDSSAFEDVYVSIPNGGPIFLSDMVGPLTRVSDFQSSVEDELTDLRKELLCLDSTEKHPHEIWVDELKILSEEELVDIAFQASLQDGNFTRDSSLSTEDCSDGTTNFSTTVDADVECSAKLGTEEDYVPSGDPPRRSMRRGNNRKMNANVIKKSKTRKLKDTADEEDYMEEVECSANLGTDEDFVPSGDPPRRSKRRGNNRKMNANVIKKSKTRKQKDTADEEDYMLEVEKLVQVKQQQEEDKSAARLHCYSGTSGPVVCLNSSEKKERLSSFNFTNFSTKVKSSSTGEQVPLRGNEILLCVELYYMNRQSMWVKTREILVLGNQLLTELRDKLYCLTDEIMKLDEKYDPSGYFLIEDTFYNDLRESTATDYSKPILDWLRESKQTALVKWEYIINGEMQQKQKKVLGNGSGSGPNLPQFRAHPMQATRFCDLTFRLGAGYLYCHQGDCKHMLVIRDMRLVHPDDVQNRGAYPLTVFQSRLRFQKCWCCKIFRAVKVTVDDKWAPQNPCYFCISCYYMLHYSNNELLYDEFKVFDYIHD